MLRFYLILVSKQYIKDFTFFNAVSETISEIWSGNAGSSNGYDSLLGGDRSPAYTLQPPLEEKEKGPEPEENKEDRDVFFCQHTALQTSATADDESCC